MNDSLKDTFLDSALVSGGLAMCQKMLFFVLQILKTIKFKRIF